ncbi:MnhB domain-containing protein [Haloparvum sp. AD34]
MTDDETNIDESGSGDGPTDGDSVERDSADSDLADEGREPTISPIERQRSPYTESQVIMSAVKVMAPFVFTFGLFITFHGADSPGGGFQGGAIIAAVILMIAFAFGIEATREWLSNAVVVALAAGGVVVFGGIGVVALALGGNFLEYARLPIKNPVKYGMEAIEIGGIAAIVSGVLVGLFFLLAAGFATAEVNE